MTKDVFELVGIMRMCGFVVILLQIMIFIGHYMNYNNIEKTSKWAFMYTILSVISSGLTTLFWGIYWIFNISILKYLAWMCFGISAISMYLYLFHNLYYEFKNTRYSISWKTFTILLVLFIASILGINIELIYFPSFIEATITGIILCFILSSLLLVLFIHKLCKIGKELNYNYDRQSKEAINLTDYIELKQNLEDGIENIAIKASKIFMLNIIILILSELYGGFYLIYCILLNDISNIILRVYAVMCYIIIGWCMMLSFPFMNTWYKYCCNANCIKEYCTKQLSRNSNNSLNARQALIDGNNII